MRHPFKKQGMTLVELLVAIPMMVIVGGVVVAMLYHFMMLHYANGDAASAARRAELVFTILEQPVHHIGLGVTTASSEDYKAAWGTDGPFIKDWDDNCESAIYIPDASARMGIVYAVPTGMIAVAKTAASSTASFTIPLVDNNLPDIPLWPGTPDAANTNIPDMRFWVSTPGTDTSVPMLVRGYNKTTPNLTVEIPGSAPADFAIQMHQEIFRMKAALAEVTTDTSRPEGYGRHKFRMSYLTKSLTDASDVIEVEGIRAIRFLLSDNWRHLEIRVLAMGDAKDLPYSKNIVPRLRSRWSELTDDDEGYYMEEFSVKWRLRDLGNRDTD